jgi:hypothetical protein
MTSLDRADAYLTIPPRCGTELGGLWWSSNGDALERRDGTTLAVVDEIRAVLEGVLTAPPVPPFAFVLNLLHLMKRGGAGADSLKAAFEATRGTAARGRNVGLLIAELCRPLPHAAGGFRGQDLSVALRVLGTHGPRQIPDLVEEPPLTRSEFEERIFARLAEFDHATLVHWLTHGCAPTGAGKRLAKQAETLPERVARLLTHARRRDRLVGAAALVPALDAAVALPPRGRPPESLPVGGYHDVTTRGDPARLLPGQFALDPDEFVRRFAGNELLYFQREEPHEAVRAERVVVLDQGVRTWGSVRLALTAAALSLLRVDARRCGRARLFLTSAPWPIDLAEPGLADADLVSAADRLEASDLTPNPQPALVRALQEPAPGPRDVILLTHPRSARARATFAGVARQPGDRLFTLAVDDTGAAELGEWSDGGPVSLRSFRVDLVTAEAARPASDAPAARPRGADAEWSGDVEPVPFPFRPGLLTEPLEFGFSADGDWLVIAGRDGVLHGLTFDGTPPEVLPRPYRAGVALKHVDAILGVTGGAVVCGRMTVGSVAHMRSGARGVELDSDASEQPSDQLVAAHFDRAARRVTLHVFGAIIGEERWTAHPDLHCIAVRNAKSLGRALDLATHGWFPAPRGPASALVSRARVAWDRSRSSVPPYDVPIYAEPPEDRSAWCEPFLLRVNRQMLHLMQAPSVWHPSLPLSDGMPLLLGSELHRAQLAGDVLAVAHTNGIERRILLLRGPDGRVLGEVAHPVKNTFTLSPDGRLLARRDVARAVAVSATADPARTLATAGPAALHDALKLEFLCDPFLLIVIVGGYQHAFRLESGELAYKARWEVSARPTRTISIFSPAATAHDPARFPPAETAHAGRWRAVVDRLGQVLLLRNPAGPVVAAFVVRRERAAAWAPGGTFWGDPRLIGGPATPDAARKIARAITDAEGA